MPWDIFWICFFWGGGGGVVCYTAVYSVVTQDALRDDAKNGCLADKGGGGGGVESVCSLSIIPFILTLLFPPPGVKYRTFFSLNRAFAFYC